MTTNEKNLNNISVFVVLWRKRKIIIALTSLAAITSVIISLMMPDYYKSVAIIFPAKTSSVILDENYSVRGNMTEFGEEENAEQLLQILNSAEIRERVITDHNLYEHYGIDSTQGYARTKITKEYMGNISFNRTRYGSIEIVVLDQNPDTAALIANHIANLVDTVKNRMIRDRVLKPYKIVQAQFDTLMNEMEALKREIRILSDSGVVSMHERGSLIDGLAEARLEGSGSEAIRELQKKISINNRLGTVFDAAIEMRIEKTKRLEALRKIRDQMRADANLAIAHKFQVEYAGPAERKSFPVRSLIVALSTLSTFFFSVLLVLFMERFKEIRAQAAGK
jgi:capsular polysaccharide biosynthesis protein